MLPLSHQAETLLRHLVGLLPDIDPSHPETFTTYKKVHDDLGLAKIGRSWGESLMVLGLVELAKWAQDQGLPAITGIVVSGETYEPGKGYFSLHEPNQNAYAWWRDEIIKAKGFPWSQVLGTFTPVP